MNATDAKITPAELGIPDRIPMPRRSDWKIGMIGFGGVARGGHAPVYRNIGWNIAAVADPDPEARRVATEQFGVKKTYADYHDLIADPAIEVIELLTQPTIREEVVRAAAAAKKPIITEKPFAQSAEEGARMVEIAAKAGIPIAVHQNYRWMRMNWLAHHIVRQGLIGAPFFVGIEILGVQDVSIADHPFYPKCDNFLTVQWDNHLADLMRWWTGHDARRVMARTGRMNGQNFRSDNLLVAVSDFGPGLTGHVLHSELLRSTLGGVRCRIDGDKGSIEFDFHSSLRIESSVIGGGPRMLDTGEIKTTVEFPESFAGSMGDFLRFLEGGPEPVNSGRNNLATVRTFIAEDKSAKEGGVWVEV